MNFSEALELMKQGKKIRRRKWENGVELYLKDNNFWFIRKDIIMPTGLPYNDISGLPYKDIIANDWEECQKPLLTEEEKEYLKMVIKFSDMEIKTIERGELGPYLILSNGIKVDTIADFKKGCFSKMEKRKQYTLEELGLDE